MFLDLDNEQTKTRMAIVLYHKVCMCVRVSLQ